MCFSNKNLTIICVGIKKKYSIAIGGDVEVGPDQCVEVQATRMVDVVGQGKECYIYVL